MTSAVVPAGPWQYILPLKEDNLSITVKLAGPKVSVTVSFK